MSVIIPPTPSFPANAFNYSPGNLKNWRKALARVRLGAGNARILCVGDSTTFGYGATTGSNVPPLAWPAQFSALMNKIGVNAHGNSWLGVGTSGGGFVGYQYFDTRLTFGSSWSNGPYPVFSVGGYPMSATTGTNAIAFTPTVNVDTFRIFYISGSTGSSNYGSFTANINGGANTTVNTNTGTSGIGVATVTGTLGANTLNINWSANGRVYIVGAEAYDSSKSWVSVINAGWTGATSATWTLTADNFGPNKGLALMGQDLTIICLGINDWNTALGVSTYKTNMQSLITNALAGGGDVVLVTPFPTDPTYGGAAPVATQLQYTAAMYALAQANNLVLVDNYARFGSYATASALSFTFDFEHPDAAGYVDFAQGVMSVIANP